MKFLRSWQAILTITSIMIALLLIPWLQEEMKTIRESEGLTNLQPIENAPPLVAFTTVALGGFRGLLSDFLFLRLQAMQEREEFFEIVQLASWIVKLEPRFTAVTTFLAWNMAYNVSVMFGSPEDRWRWVEYGIELLRDQALKYNPGDPLLCRELGWIYQHKIGQTLDDAHLYYKTQLAQQVIEILGDDTVYNWANLAASPTSEEKLVQALGEAAAPLLKFFEEHGATIAKMETKFRTEAKFDLETKETLAEMGVLQIIENYFRVRWLKADLKLDATVINELVNRYGPLDFRLPEAHAIYWGMTGLKRSTNAKNIDCDRMIFQSLKSAFIAGKLMKLTDTSIMHISPNIALADSVRMTYLDVMKRHSGNKAVISAYENFMVDAIVILYLYSEREKAEKYLCSMREMSEHGQQKNKRYRKDVDEFVLHELAGDIQSASRDKVLAILKALLLQSYNSVAFGDYNRATGSELMAKKVYTSYMKKIDKGRDTVRRGLPNYDILQRQYQDEFIETSPMLVAHRFSEKMKSLKKGIKKSF